MKIEEFFGKDKAVEDSVWDYYMQNKNAENSPVKLTTFKPRPKSMFDAFLKACEHVPSEKHLAGYLKHTKVFNFEEKCCYDAKLIAASSRAVAELELKKFYDLPLSPDMLGLPFPNITIVTPDASIMFNALEGRPDSYMYTGLVNMHGSELMRWFCNGLIIIPDDLTAARELRIANCIYLINKSDNKWVAYNTKDKYDASLIKPVIGKAMSLIMQLNTPDRFIMEVAPLSAKIKSNKYIPKSHQRPEYIVLHPHVIRKYMKTESDVVAGDKRRGHERRAHNRVIPNDPIRWPNAHGKVIRIQAVWIGQTEAIIGDRQYKVIL